MRLTPQKVSGETAQFAVFVRSTAGVGRTTDMLRYLYAASPLQQLLQFYAEYRALASSVTPHPQMPGWCP
jgi:hypothetical protein